jgi:hypothetical protein
MCVDAMFICLVRFSLWLLFSSILFVTFFETMNIIVDVVMLNGVSKL